MLFGGAPMEGPRYLWWNFVSSGRERIEQAKEEWARGRFDTVPGDEAEFIPLPDKADAPLRAHGGVLYPVNLEPFIPSARKDISDAPSHPRPFTTSPRSLDRRRTTSTSMPALRQHLVKRTVNFDDPGTSPPLLWGSHGLARAPS
jgi:hypothetical protein